MCIRDRANPAREDALAKAYLTGDFGDLERLEDAPASSPYAVSYTHLRAHETVLDLVCRLLLETKKTSQHKY